MSGLVNLSALIDDAKCFELVRQTRWPTGTACPKCGGGTVVRNGHDDTQRHRQRYTCKTCQFRFDSPLRHRPGWPPPALADVDIVLVFHGFEPVEPANCGRIEPERK